MAITPTIQRIRTQASEYNGTVMLPDSHDPRTLNAARLAVDSGLFTPILVGSAQEIQSLARESSVELAGIAIADPTSDERTPLLANRLLSNRAAKGMSPEDAAAAATQPLLWAGLAVAEGFADGAVGGSLSTTADIIRAGLWTIGTAEGINTVSSFFLMGLPTGDTVCFADCGVVPDPTIDQLVDIAVSASANYQRLTAEIPRIAMLSFSTHGSAEHPLASKMKNAAEMVRQRLPDFVVDGELQFDAAFVPDVAKRKAPSSPLEGSANVFIFPDLNSGNIAYKVAQRIGGAEAIGPIVQGLAKPYLDLSRGCSSADIVTSGCVAVLLSR